MRSNGELARPLKTLRSIKTIIALLNPVFSDLRRHIPHYEISDPNHKVR